MHLSRRLAVFLLAVAAWNLVTWSMFIRNLAATEGRPTGYYVAHGILIVVNLAIAVALGIVGWRGLRARPADRERADRTPAARP